MPSLSPLQPSPRKHPGSSLKWPIDPSYITNSWQPATPRESPFREEDPAHFWKAFGTNKLGYEKLDAAVFSNRLDVLTNDEPPSRPRSRFREREAFAEQHRQRYLAIKKGEENGDIQGEASLAADSRGVVGGGVSKSSQANKQHEQEAQQTLNLRPHKISVLLRIGGAKGEREEASNTKGYADQFYSTIVTSKVSRTGMPSKPTAPAPTRTTHPPTTADTDRRGALLRRSVAAVVDSFMCDVTVDALMSESARELDCADPSQGAVVTPRSAVESLRSRASREP
jgi:hypothetical protein